MAKIDNVIYYIIRLGNKLNKENLGIHFFSHYSSRVFFFYYKNNRIIVDFQKRNRNFENITDDEEAIEVIFIDGETDKVSKFDLKINELEKWIVIKLMIELD